MAPLFFLIFGILCALIARALLIGVAFRISTRWGVAVLAPFGPLVFRLNYPEKACASALFRWLTLPCIFLYVILGPGPSLRSHLGRAANFSLPLGGYGLEKTKKSDPLGHSAGPIVQTSPDSPYERAANTQSFEQLRAWAEALRLKKRDLLHSDAAGNVAYTEELARYEAALARARAERSLLWPAAR